MQCGQCVQNTRQHKLKQRCGARCNPITITPTLESLDLPALKPTLLFAAVHMSSQTPGQIWAHLIADRFALPTMAREDRSAA
jgi:hypothetical protein